MNTGMMMSIPLVPGNPGSSHTLPRTSGGPIVQVMTMPASHNLNSSLLAQRLGRPLEPGEKIPGVPGYSVPPGFRGRVILGHNLPVEAQSRGVMEGFNTRVKVSNPSSDTVYTSISGLQAAQQRVREDGTARLHVTLGGYRQLPDSSSASNRMQQGTAEGTFANQQHRYSDRGPSSGITHSSMRAQRPAPTGDVWQSGSQSSSGKSWDGRRRISGETWDRSWSSDRSGMRDTRGQNRRQSWKARNRDTRGEGSRDSRNQPEICWYYLCTVV